MTLDEMDMIHAAQNRASAIECLLQAVQHMLPRGDPSRIALGGIEQMAGWLNAELGAFQTDATS